MKELLKNIGKLAIFNTEGLRFEVEITNVRKAFGRIDYEIKPLAGADETWVSAARLEIV